jgi:TPR repeat protein
VSSSSVNIPEDLPEIEGSAGQEEEKWEKRATLLAKTNPNQEGGAVRPATPQRRPSREQITEGDDDIQEAIRLHEEGDLTKSTEMFGRLADPHGANNCLSQVLYGLALRHGWGIAKDESKAVIYLSHAASNSAGIEELALQAGMKKGGSAKGELTLAIFELANCFRNGWGVKKDPVAAKQYYETAANMGDTDAMNEVAWCYLEGFGCKKDKVRN